LGEKGLKFLEKPRPKKRKNDSDMMKSTHSNSTCQIDNEKQRKNDQYNSTNNVDNSKIRKLIDNNRDLILNDDKLNDFKLPLSPGNVEKSLSSLNSPVLKEKSETKSLKKLAGIACVEKSWVARVSGENVLRFRVFRNNL
jgi:DNA polymerase II small subunit/DNA polymerase delta subunit B